MADIERDKGGRPTKFTDSTNEQAYKYALLGATDKQLAKLLEIDESTLNEWKHSKPGFSESLRSGKDEADALVAKSLFHKATGYEHEAVKIVADAKTGAEHIVHYTEHYAPDTTAGIFWLKNRQRDNWRDKTETDLTSKGEQIQVANPELAAGFADYLKNK